MYVRDARERKIEATNADFFFVSARCKRKRERERERESNTTIPTRSSGTQSNSIANEEEEQEEEREHKLFQSKRSERKSTEYIKKESEQNAPDSDSSPLGSSSLSLSRYQYIYKNDA